VVNFLADECCDTILVAGLRGDGHDVAYIKEIAPGADDDAFCKWRSASNGFC